MYLPVMPRTDASNVLDGVRATIGEWDDVVDLRVSLPLNRLERRMETSTANRSRRKASATGSRTAARKPAYRIVQHTVCARRVPHPHGERSHHSAAYGDL